MRSGTEIGTEITESVSKTSKVIADTYEIDIQCYESAMESAQDFVHKLKPNNERLNWKLLVITQTHDQKHIHFSRAVSSGKICGIQVFRFNEGKGNEKGRFLKMVGSVSGKPPLQTLRESKKLVEEKRWGYDAEKLTNANQETTLVS